MSTTYSIRIFNRTQQDQDYHLIVSPPNNATGGKFPGFSNVYVSTGSIDQETGSASITIPWTIFAICGVSAQPLSPGISVDTSDFVPVTLGTATTPGTTANVEVAGFNPRFVKPFGTINGVGAFAINTNAYNNAEFPNVFIGIGMLPDTGIRQPIPVATINAQPATTYTVHPIPSFLLGAGDLTTGETVNIQTMSQLATIDFSTALPGQVIANVTQAADGTFQVAFAFPRPSLIGGEIGEGKEGGEVGDGEGKGEGYGERYD